MHGEPARYFCCSWASQSGAERPSLWQKEGGRGVGGHCSASDAPSQPPHPTPSTATSPESPTLARAPLWSPTNFCPTQTSAPFRTHTRTHNHTHTPRRPPTEPSPLPTNSAKWYC